ncbi:MAG: gamma-glutamyltransferase family protein [Burkholderiales bacterium]|nr:gamma-glutamyltransferase family protein [Burkholderiales bacterium]
MLRLPVLLAALVVSACSLSPGHRAPAPDALAGYRQAVVTAHPLATKAGLAMLERGGSPVDAAIAAQMVLGLVEPQSSGIGGGSLVLHWDAATARLSSYDGLAAAPARATASLRTDTDGKLLPSEPSQRGGRTVGVPGTVAVLAMAHRRHGKLAWGDLFGPAIDIAERGFPMPRYLHGILSAPGAAKDLAELRELYFAADGSPLPVGATVRNPAYAKTMRRLALGGPEGFLDGGGARAIVEAAQRGFRPSLMTEDDLRDYRAVERDPVCAPFLAYRVCTMAPPSFGGLVVLQVLQMVEARAGGRFDFDDAAFAHLYAEAGKLAQADRRQHVGDPDFVAVPVAALASPAYARSRAAAIDDARAAKEVLPGLPLPRAVALAPDGSDPVAATSQIAIVDRDGNALSITTTTNLNFGSRLLVDGFMLNNALTNFSAAPRPGTTIANQMAPRKRPVTSMAPTIVFDRDGRPVVVGGSAGGGPIVDYIASSLIEMLANGRTPAEALARGHLSTAAPGKVQLEKGTAATRLAPALAARGHAVEEVPLVSGLGFLKRTASGWIGAADPRRDGVALGN